MFHKRWTEKRNSRQRDSVQPMPIAPKRQQVGSIRCWYRTVSLPQSAGEFRWGCTVEGRGRVVAP
jgi:hypothetical protein